MTFGGFKIRKMVCCGGVRVKFSQGLVFAMFDMGDKGKGSEHYLNVY
jgi:hypothetical protein